MEYVLQTNSLCKQYRSFRALDHLTMHVPKGSIYGFVGKNGAGKTTLIRLISGLQAPTSGDYSLYGIRVSDTKALARTMDRMGLEYHILDEGTADIFSGGIYTLFIAAVFVGVFVGTEYSDGTIRNKIITGHSRCRIYLANTLVCTLAAVLMNLSFILATLILGDAILTPSRFSTREILFCSLSSSAAIAAATTVYLLFAMLIQSRAIASVCALATALVLSVHRLRHPRPAGHT